MYFGRLRSLGAKASQRRQRHESPEGFLFVRKISFKEFTGLGDEGFRGFKEFRGLGVEGFRG